MTFKSGFAAQALAALTLATLPVAAIAYDHGSWDIHTGEDICIAATTNGPDAIAIGEPRTDAGVAMVGIYAHSLAPVVTLKPEDVKMVIDGAVLPTQRIDLGPAKPEIRPNVLAITSSTALFPYMGKPFELQILARGKTVWRERIDLSGQALSDYMRCVRG